MSSTRSKTDKEGIDKAYEEAINAFQKRSKLRRSGENTRIYESCESGSETNDLSETENDASCETETSSDSSKATEKSDTEIGDLKEIAGSLNKSAILGSPRNKPQETGEIGINLRENFPAEGNNRATELIIEKSLATGSDCDSDNYNTTLNDTTILRLPDDLPVKPKGEIIPEKTESRIMSLPTHLSISLRDALDGVPRYDGTNIPFTEFAQRCLSAKSSIPVEAEINLVRLIVNKLSGKARSVGETGNSQTVSELLNELKKTINKPKSLSQLQGKLGQIHQLNKEDVFSFASRIKILGQEIQESYKFYNEGQMDAGAEKSTEREMLRRFLAGLIPAVGDRIRDRTNIGSAIEEAITIESELESPVHNVYDNRTYNYDNREQPLFTTENCQICLGRDHKAAECKIRYQKTTQEQFTPTAENCQICSARDHKANECKNRYQKPSQEQFNYAVENCQICSGQDHKAAECKNRYPNFITTRKDNSRFNIMICQVCNKRGHEALQCRQRSSRRVEERAVRYIREDPIQCQLCKGAGHTANDCPYPRGPGTSYIQKQNCQLCHRFGHTADYCRATPPSITCQYCHKSGHSAEKCWQNRPNQNIAQQMSCQICKRSGHTAETCYRKNQQSTFPSDATQVCRYCRDEGHTINNCIARERAEQRKREQGNETGHTQQGVRRETSQLARPLNTRNITKP